MRCWRSERLAARQRFAPGPADRFGTGRDGFTLLEVVVGLALMASLLVGTLLAFSAHRKQLAHAEAKLQAITVADEMLNAWSGSRRGIPQRSGGPLPGRRGWTWHTTTVRDVMPAEIPVRVVRLQIFRTLESGPIQRLARVEVATPLPMPVETAGRAEGSPR